MGFGGFGSFLINLMLQRGFSTRFDAELDMRMSQKMTSMLIRSLMNMTTNLKRVFLDYGELKNALFWRTIVEAREVQLIKTTDELKEVLAYLPDRVRNKILAQIYQAIRIEVNQEMDVLKEFLEQSLEVLKPEGDLV
jgi:16S rRNA (cytosine1402-N4)-methyltransferase